MITVANYPFVRIVPYPQYGTRVLISHFDSEVNSLTRRRITFNLIQY
jgi:hypothetical protein